MRRFPILALLVLSGCGGDGGRDLDLSLLPGEVTIEASLGFGGTHRATFVGGDGEATMVWSQFQPDGSTLMLGQVVGFDLDPGHRDIVSVGSGNTRKPAACRHDRGLTVTWTTSATERPQGVTLNMSDVAAVTTWPPGGEAEVVNPNPIGSQHASTVACLPSGRRVFGWTSYCIAERRVGDTSFIYVPEECDSEPADGSYVGILDEGGLPLADQFRITGGLFLPPLLAATGEDRFVAVAGARVQSWNGTELVDELTEADVWSGDAALACSGSHCAAVSGGQILMFDATDLSSNRLVVFEESRFPSADEAIFARDATLACDQEGSCVVTWVLVHETVDYDAEYTETIGVHAAALDIRTGILGDRISIREPVMDEFGTLVAATGPGRFLLASVLEENLVVQRLVMD